MSSSEACARTCSTTGSKRVRRHRALRSRLPLAFVVVPYCALEPIVFNDAFAFGLGAVLLVVSLFLVFGAGRLARTLASQP